MKNLISILVALGPAIASTILVFATEIAPALFKLRDSILKRKKVADRIQEYLLLMAGGATGVGALLGFQQNTANYLISGLVASLCIMFMDIAISYRRDALEQEEPVKKVVRKPLRSRPRAQNSATRWRRS